MAHEQHEQHERVLYTEQVFRIQGVIIELNALAMLLPEHRAQVLNDLRVTGIELGLLVNFGCGPKARIERLVH
jgi:GxxExxY protein